MKRKTFVGLLAGVGFIAILILVLMAQVVNSGPQCRIVRIYDETVVSGEARIEDGRS